jgi:multiple sugar transport system permease protein
VETLLALPGEALALLDTLFDRCARGRLGDLPLALLLLAPACGILALFSQWPMLEALHMSLYGGKHGAGSFVGLGNYWEALNAPDFQRSALVTFYYVLGTVPATLVLSFVVAYALFHVARGQGFFRTIYFLPYVTSAVAAAVVWRALFNPQAGLFNALLRSVGLPVQQWLLEPRGVLHVISGGALPAEWGPSLALCCIMVFDIWHGSGFAIVIFLAALTAIPREMLEAARIDGAGTRAVLRHVVLPLLLPTVLFLTVVGGVRGFQAFNSFYALTQGGGRAVTGTENLILYIYAQFYEYGYWGYGAAAATLMSAMIIALTVVQWRVLGRRDGLE